MDPRTQERVEQWDSRPFSGGYDGLSDLADADFSGSVTAAGTWLFMLNGRVVGVVDGEIEDFEAASGTVYEAPDPALPLLCTMEERGGETRAKYYTNDTPLREVDQTLQSGSFTGYVELSENVLSGDYYAVYYGGRRMAAAYIGNAERLLTGEEAFERAADEVGIYEVFDVEIEVTDVPGADGNGVSGDAGGDADDASSDDSSAAAAPDDSSAPAGSAADEGPRTEPSTDPTESAIDSIDISGSETGTEPATNATADDDTASAHIEDVTIDGTAASEESTEGTDSTATEPSGITAADAAADPEPAASGITDADGPSTADAAAEGSAASRAEPDADDGPTGGAEPEPTEPTTADRTGPAGEESDGQAAEGGDSSSEQTAEPRGDTAAGRARAATDSETDSGSTGGSGPDPAEVEAAAQQLEQSDISWTEDDVADSPADDAGAPERGPNAGATAGGATDAAPTSDDEGTEERFDEEAQWRETRSIPSIDPDNSQSSDSSGESGRSATTQQSRSRRGAGSGSTGSADRSGRSRDGAAGSTSAETQGASTARQTQQATASGQRGPQRADQVDTANAGSSAGRTGGAAGGAAAERVTELEERVETLEEQREKLVAKAEELQEERDQLQSENEELSSTVERLQSRIEELEAELERAREASAEADADGVDSPSASTELPPQRALAETNLFVRYGSKSQPTLESAHDGEGDRSEVASNLRLEHHTGFDASDVAVNGRPYEEFLTETMEHRFVDWLTGMLLFEIRDTGNADGLGDLYDAIPRIDRAELGASISLEDDDTEDVPDQVTFDVVAFDKMGNPLVVANLNDSRDPATQGMLEEMEEAASAVKANYPDLAASIVVTSSYFEPGALEVAEQATSGGLLSRGSKLSYVNLSRKEGYHLCLVESRSEGFHMNVPEL